MKVDDLLEEVPTASDPGDGWAALQAPAVKLRTSLLQAARRAPLADPDDLTLAMPLTQLVHDDLERYATDGGQRIDDDEMSTALLALRAVLRRLEIALELPFRNFTTFRTHWMKEGLSGGGSWQARREFLSGIFEPVHAALLAQEERMFEAGAGLATAISPRGRTGWAAVDDEIAQLRRGFTSARTPQDYRAVGNSCVGVLESLSRTVYNPDKHLRTGEELPPPDKTKQRLDRYVEVALGGAADGELRAAVRKIIELAQSVKHRQTPTRRDAGIAADSVILLANMLRRVDQDF